MNKYALCLAAALITSPAMAITEYPAVGCWPKATVEQLLGAGNYTVLVRAKALGDKINEYWINSKNFMITLEFPKPKENDAKNIDSVCVTSVVGGVVYNGDTIDMLYKALEKSTPKT